MNLTTKRINLRLALFSGAALASMLGGMIFIDSAVARPRQSYERVREARVRSHCRQAVFPSPGENYNGYFKCLRDRGVYRLQSWWWKREVKRHCDNAPYPFGAGGARKKCYRDRGVSPPR